MSATTQREIPPLSELVRMDRLSEVMDWAVSLSLPEVLIVGARPLNREERPAAELKEFGRVAKEKLEQLERDRERISRAILDNLYRGLNMAVHPVNDYLGKYEFLVRRVIIPEEVEARLDRDIVKEIRDYRKSIGVYRMGDSGRVPPNIRELKRLEETPVNLTFLYRRKYEGKEPHLVVAKTKSPLRIAGKIPYKMIEAYRDREKGIVDGNGFRKHIRLQDGVIRDIVGLQFVTLSLDEVVRIKEEMYTSPVIEVVHDRKETDIDDKSASHSIYRALHIDAVWNPRKSHEKGSRINIYNPHAPTIEIMLIELPYFVGGANFGPKSYWRRLIAQEYGIVMEHLSHGGHGKLVKVDFTPAEMAWKKTVQVRVMEVLSYAGRK